MGVDTSTQPIQDHAQGSWELRPVTSFSLSKTSKPCHMETNWWRLEPRLACPSDHYRTMTDALLPLVGATGIHKERQLEAPNFLLRLVEYEQLVRVQT